MYYSQRKTTLFQWIKSLFQLLLYWYGPMKYLKQTPKHFSFLSIGTGKISELKLNLGMVQELNPLIV